MRASSPKPASAWRAGVCLLLLAWGLPALAAGPVVSAPELRSYLATHPEPKPYTPAINPLIEVLTHTPQHPQAVIDSLASRWGIPEDHAASALVLLLASQESHASRVTRERVRTAISRLTRGPFQSRETWRVVLWYLDGHGGCGDRALRERYFRNAWAVPELLRSEVLPCEEWLLAVPAHAPASALFYARLAERQGMMAGADELAALRAFRDALQKDGVSTTDPAWLYAQRHYWLRLAEHGVWKPLIAQARSLPPETLQAVLEGRTNGQNILVDGFVLERDPYAASVARQLQPAWLLALLSGGQGAEARQWMQRWGWNQPERLPVPRSGPIADEQLQQRDLVRRLVLDSPTEDAFEVFVNHDELTGGLMDSARARELAVSYLTQHAYPDLAAYLRELPCGPPEHAPVSLNAFPAEFKALREEAAAQLAEASSPDCPQSREELPGGERRTERPLPKALRWQGPRGPQASIPAWARAPLKAYNVVRYSRTGERAAAISLSQEADPVGDSGGGYWLHLSEDRGHTWHAPVYLGLQQRAPYTIVSHSHLQLLAGKLLRVEVEARESESRTADPRSRHLVRDFYIELPLEEIERDSDGDGLTDLLEERLHTDPHDRDTDHDGLEDAVDPLPQVSVKLPAPADAEVVRVAVLSLLGDPPGEAPVRTSESPASVPVFRAGALFVQADRILFQGMTLPDRVVVVTPEEARTIRRHAAFQPVELHVLFNHARSRAFVQWYAGGRGGMLRFEKKEGRWLPPERSRDITLSCPQGRRCRMKPGRSAAEYG